MLALEEFEQNIDKYQDYFRNYIGSNYKNLPFYRVIKKGEKYYRNVIDRDLLLNLITNPMTDMSIMKYIPYPDLSVPYDKQRIWCVPSYEKVKYYYYIHDMDDDGNPINLPEGYDTEVKRIGLKIPENKYDTIPQYLLQYYNLMEFYKAKTVNKKLYGDEAFYIEYKNIPIDNKIPPIFYYYSNDYDETSRRFTKSSSYMMKPLQNLDELTDIDNFVIHYDSFSNIDNILVPKSTTKNTYPDTLFDVILYASSRWGTMIDSCINPDLLNFVRTTYYIKYHATDQNSQETILSLAADDYRVADYISDDMWTEELAEIVLANDGTKIDKVVDVMKDQGWADENLSDYLSSYISQALETSPSSVEQVISTLKKYEDLSLHIDETQLINALAQDGSSLKYIPMEEGHKSASLNDNIIEDVSYIDSETGNRVSLTQNYNIIFAALSNRPDLIEFVDENLLWEYRDYVKSLLQINGLLLCKLCCFNGFKGWDPVKKEYIKIIVKYNEHTKQVEYIGAAAVETNAAGERVLKYKDMDLIMTAIRQNQKVFNRYCINFDILYPEDLYKIITEFPDLYAVLTEQEKRSIQDLIDNRLEKPALPSPDALLTQWKVLK